MFYLFLLAHLVADFVLQPFWLVVRKRYWYGLLIHSSIVFGCMLLLPLVDPASRSLWPIMLGISVIHAGTDWLKVHYGDRVPGPPIVSFMLDQVVHVCVIWGMLSLVLPVEHIWAPGLSPATHMAIYGSVYIIAALGVPIGVIVWLDPIFAHRTCAVGARLRSLVASVVAISCMLIGGVLALPAILIGLTLAIHHPRSQHPLDTPAGMLVVLIIATLLAAILMLLPV